MLTLAVLRHRASTKPQGARRVSHALWDATWNPGRSGATACAAAPQAAERSPPQRLAASPSLVRVLHTASSAVGRSSCSSAQARRNSDRPRGHHEDTCEPRPCAARSTRHRSSLAPHLRWAASTVSILQTSACSTAPTSNCCASCPRIAARQYSGSRRRPCTFASRRCTARFATWLPRASDRQTSMLSCTPSSAEPPGFSMAAQQACICPNPARRPSAASQASPRQRTTPAWSCASVRQRPGMVAQTGRPMLIPDYPNSPAALSALRAPDRSRPCFRLRWWRSSV